MKSTHSHPGWPFAQLTAAGFTALARGEIRVLEDDYKPGVLWDWDQRTSRGARRRPVMHLIGLKLSPSDFDPSQNIEFDFDDEGNPEGAYYADNWDAKPAAALLEGIGELEPGQRVLIALWDRDRGHVAVLEGGEEYVNVNAPRDYEGPSWSPADPSAQPEILSSRCGVSLVVLDAHPPRDPGEHTDTAGMHGLLEALDDLLFHCPFEVYVRDYAEDSEFPPGTELAQVRGLGARLERAAEFHGRVQLDGRGPTGGPFAWFLLHTAPRFSLIGHVVRIRGGTLITAAAAPGDDTWELMRGYGIEAGADHVVIGDHDHSDGRQQAERAALFQRELPPELLDHNKVALNTIRMVGAQALDTRLKDLHEVWDALAAWEGPVREHAETEEFIRAYAAPGSGWPKSQSKSSPSIVWIGEREGNRPRGYLEGLAGAYHPERDLLEVNADFPSFRALQAYWQDQYLPLAETTSIGPPSQVIETVSEVVREWCEQTLVEVVVGVNQLAGRPGWDEARVRAALSPEALSGAALAIHHVQQSIKRSLGQRLGSLKETKTM